MLFRTLKTIISKELAYPKINIKAASRKLDRIMVQTAMKTSVIGHSNLWSGTNKSNSSFFSKFSNVEIYSWD